MCLGLWLELWIVRFQIRTCVWTSWDVLSVTNMAHMFHFASEFNQPLNA